LYIVGHIRYDKLEQHHIQIGQGQQQSQERGREKHCILLREQQQQGRESCIHLREQQVLEHCIQIAFVSFLA